MITMTHSARQALERFMTDEGPNVGLRVYITPMDSATSVTHGDRGSPH